MAPPSKHLPNSPHTPHQAVQTPRPEITQRLQDVRLLPVPAALDPVAISTAHQDWGAPEPYETPAPGALGAHLPPVMPLFQCDLGHQNLWPAEKSWGGTGSTRSSPGSG